MKVVTAKFNSLLTFFQPTLEYCSVCSVKDMKKVCIKLNQQPLDTVLLKSMMHDGKMHDQDIIWILVSLKRSFY